MQEEVVAAAPWPGSEDALPLFTGWWMGVKPSFKKKWMVPDGEVCLGGITYKLIHRRECDNTEVFIAQH